MATSTVTIEANSLAVRSAGNWLWELLSGLGSPEADRLRSRLELPLHEICMNAVDHAGLGDGANLTLTGSIDADRVLVEVSDQGGPFDERNAVEPRPGVPQVRGYGLMIVRKLVDELRYSRTDGTNSWTLIVRRDRRRSAGDECDVNRSLATQRDSSESEML